MPDPTPSSVPDPTMFMLCMVGVVPAVGRAAAAGPAGILSRWSRGSTGRRRRQ